MIIKSAEGLNTGDVLQVSKQVTPRDGGSPYWWKTFRVVTAMPVSKRFVHTLLLKLEPDHEKDRHIVDLHAEDHVVETLDPDRWPQGVIAMRMRYIHKGILKLDE